MAASRRGQQPLFILPLPDLSSSSPSLVGASASVGGPVSGGGPATAHSTTTDSDALPAAAALFLVVFDVKAGYTIAWRRTAADAGAGADGAGIELDGAVEYKSLPSGLHAVPEDLVYFVQGAHAGLSAFVNAPTHDAGMRNARMLAVGVLVPLSYGRLGRAWRLAEGLKEVAG